MLIKLGQFPFANVKDLILRFQIMGFIADHISCPQGVRELPALNYQLSYFVQFYLELGGNSISMVRSFYERHKLQYFRVYHICNYKNRNTSNFT